MRDVAVTLRRCSLTNGHETHGESLSGLDKTVLSERFEVQRFSNAGCSSKFINTRLPASEIRI